MEYQKIINQLDNTLNQPSKFRKIKNHDSRVTVNNNSHIKFKTMILKSTLCDYRDANMLVKEVRTITIAGADEAAKLVDQKYEGVLFKICAPFSSCISKIYNTKGLYVLMPMYNLIEYSDNYSKKSVGLWQCNRIFQEILNHSNPR